MRSRRLDAIHHQQCFRHEAMGRPHIAIGRRTLRLQSEARLAKLEVLPDVFRYRVGVIDLRVTMAKQVGHCFIGRGLGFGALAIAVCLATTGYTAQ